MKRLLCLALAFCLLAVMTACQNKAADTGSKPQPIKTVSTEAKTVEENVSAGKIPELQFALGQNAQEMMDLLAPQTADDGEEVEEEDEAQYTLLEKNDFNNFTDGTVEYYYKADGIVTCIATSETAFGLEGRPFSDEIEVMMDGYVPIKKQAVEVPFLPTGEKCDCFIYSFGENAVAFLFYEQQLIKTVVFRADAWLTE